MSALEDIAAERRRQIEPNHSNRLLSALADLTASLRDELGGRLDRAEREAAEDRAGRLRAEAAAERYLAALIQARAALAPTRGALLSALNAIPAATPDQQATRRALRQRAELIAAAIKAIENP